MGLGAQLKMPMFCLKVQKLPFLWEDLDQALAGRSIFQQGEGDNLRGGAGKKCAVNYDFLINENIISFKFNKSRML